MRVRIRTWGRPKSGNTQEEYEDACWPAAVDRETTLVRLAVADGATEASFSALWAQLLVRAYCAGRLTNRLKPASLEALQAEWRQRVGSKPLPWYAEEKLRDGAFSSLLGLTFSLRHDRPHWHAVAIGDSCLVQVREEALVRAFPLDSPDAFTSRPHLLSSQPAHNGNLPTGLYRAAGDVRPGDSFFLITDAVAAWFLRAAENGGRPWEQIQAGIEDGNLDTFFDLARTAGTIRNDDFTVMLVNIE